MREDRVEFRSSNSERTQFEQAATYLNMNLSAFLRFAALEKSAEVIKEKSMLILSDKDRDLFLAALENPPEPNNNLKKAFLEYTKELNG